MPSFEIRGDEMHRQRVYVDGKELFGIKSVDIHLEEAAVPLVKIVMIADPKELVIEGAQVTAQQMMDLFPGDKTSKLPTEKDNESRPD